MLKLVKVEKRMRKSNYTQEFKESTIKFCIDNRDKDGIPCETICK